jgi:hypothetical protein
MVLHATGDRPGGNRTRDLSMISRSPSSRRPACAGKVLGEAQRSATELRARHRFPSTLLAGADGPEKSWNARRDLNPRPPSPVNLPPSARGAGKGSAKVFARCSTRLSYGHSIVRTGQQGWPTGVEPVPSDSQSDALAVELRPPRAAVFFDSGRRERPPAHGGSRCSTPRRDDGRPAGPALPRFLPRLDHPSASRARGVRTQIRPARLAARAGRRVLAPGDGS